MKKSNLIIAAIASLALVSCSNEDYMGDLSPNTNGQISFGTTAGKATRATSNSGSANEMLDNQFKVYGVKSGETAGSDIQKVFVNYGVWYGASTAKTTTSNSSNWEYVEEATSAQSHGSNDNPMNVYNQTIKYWDHSAADYRFVAGSPFGAFTFNISNTNEIQSATVTGLAGHLTPNTTSTALATNPVYIAKPLLITKDSYARDYGTAPVTFNFIRQQSRVRVGIYENIPGYVIKEIKFYTQSGSLEATNPHNVILYSATTGYFSGASNGTGTVSYTWTGTSPSYTVAYKSSGNDADVTTSQNWYGGKFLSATPNNPTTPAIPAVSSSSTGLYGTDGDMGTNSYFTVLPTASATDAAALCLKCDYVLLSEKDGSGETIKVTGATAAIPAAFTKWEPNHTYTYLFKISDNTNGSTGNNVVGLYPITFNGVVIADEGEQGTITTVTTPTITTYQEGSVTDAGIVYAANKPIYLTVADAAGTLNTLTDGGDAVGAVQVFALNGQKTEADLQITAPTGTDLFTLGSAAATVGTVSFTAGKYGSFTPTANGYYAIQYLTTTGDPAAYTYKVVKVGND